MSSSRTLKNHIVHVLLQNLSNAIGQRNLLMFYFNLLAETRKALRSSNIYHQHYVA